MTQEADDAVRSSVEPKLESEAQEPVAGHAGDSEAWKRRDALHHDREALYYDSLIGREYAPYQRTHTAVPWARLLASSGVELALDIGAGTGRTSLPLASAGIDVIAIDTSRGMLEQLRAKAHDADFDRVWPVIGDAEHLPLPAAAVGGVVCQGVLHHLPHVEVALGEADRVLAEGGWLCLAEPNASRSRVDALVRTALAWMRPLVDRLGGRRSPAAHDERPLDPQDIIFPLEAWGFEVDARYVVHPPYVYRFLPRPLVDLIARLLNPGVRRRGEGTDIVVVRAQRAGKSRGP